jgi:hypothetical protein
VGLFTSKEPHEISAEKMREALLDGYQAKILQLSKEEQGMVFDYVDSLETNFTSARQVKAALDDGIQRAQQTTAIRKQATIDYENKTFGINRRKCAKCNVEESIHSPLQLLLDHLKPIDCLPYCPKCYIAAHNKATAEYTRALNDQNKEAQRRSRPDDEL